MPKTFNTRQFRKDCETAFAKYGPDGPAIDRAFLPPDPENDNDRRSDAARSALFMFSKETGSDFGDAVCDLLGDLMHFCDRHGFDFDNELRKARGHYAEETMRSDDSPEQPDTENCSDCDAPVDREAPYFATPCGTFCEACMTKHAAQCEICATEFDLDVNACRACGKVGGTPGCAGGCYRG